MAVAIPTGVRKRPSRRGAHRPGRPRSPAWQTSPIDESIVGGASGVRQRLGGERTALAGAPCSAVQRAAEKSEKALREEDDHQDEEDSHWNEVVLREKAGHPFPQ